MGVHSLVRVELCVAGDTVPHRASPSSGTRGSTASPHPITLGVGGIEEEASPEAKMRNVAVLFPLYAAQPRGQDCASLSGVFLGAAQIALGL